MNITPSFSWSYQTLKKKKETFEQKKLLYFFNVSNSTFRILKKNAIVLNFC